MPGPVSDSYDPEFGTAANRHDVIEGLRGAHKDISGCLGDELKHIVGVAQGDDGERMGFRTNERQLRLIRFAINAAIKQLEE